MAVQATVRRRACLSSRSPSSWAFRSSSLCGTCHGALTTSSLRAWWKRRPLSLLWSSKGYLPPFGGQQPQLPGSRNDWLRALLPDRDLLKLAPPLLKPLRLSGHLLRQGRGPEGARPAQALSFQQQLHAPRLSGSRGRTLLDSGPRPPLTAGYHHPTGHLRSSSRTGSTQSCEQPGYPLRGRTTPPRTSSVLWDLFQSGTAYGVAAFCGSHFVSQRSSGMKSPAPGLDPTLLERAMKKI